MNEATGKLFKHDCTLDATVSIATLAAGSTSGVVFCYNLIAGNEHVDPEIITAHKSKGKKRTDGGKSLYALLGDMSKADKAAVSLILDTPKAKRAAGYNRHQASLKKADPKPTLQGIKKGILKKSGTTEERKSLKEAFKEAFEAFRMPLDSKAKPAVIEANYFALQLVMSDLAIEYKVYPVED